MSSLSLKLFKLVLEVQLKKDQTLKLKESYAEHFIHSGQKVKATSKVISRITQEDERKYMYSPCFY